MALKKNEKSPDLLLKGTQVKKQPWKRQLRCRRFSFRKYFTTFFNFFFQLLYFIIFFSILFTLYVRSLPWIIRSFQTIALFQILVSPRSKAIERSVGNQLISYINKNNLSETFQSAYKQYHSTETALIRVHNVIHTAINNRRTVILLLLDLSAAFDTVYHDFILSRLQERFGVTGKPFLWFLPYPCSRMQYVSVDGGASLKRALQCDVPQGSVSGPILYLLCTSPLSDIIKKLNVSYHFYADDLQPYNFLRI